MFVKGHLLLLTLIALSNNCLDVILEGSIIDYGRDFAMRSILLLPVLWFLACNFHP
jgi:hypothetical protein